MFGQVEKLNDPKPSKKMEVNFTSELMEVVMPINGQNYLIKVIIEDCQAYCSQAIRLHQLHTGGEELVRNLFKDKHEGIVSQIKSCTI